MLKKIVAVVVAVAFLFAGFVATRPAEYRVERSITTSASATDLSEWVANFHKWDDWSPWAHLDPAMKTDYSGPRSGRGASYHWKGNDKVGEGRMTITDVSPQKVDIRLEFIKPWEQTSLTEFRFQPAAGGTKVTWSMTGERDFIGKLFGIFMDMDEMVGPDFEKGLAALKVKAEQ